MYYLYKCRAIYQDGHSFEGKFGYLVNNDGTVSYNYKQGVIKFSDGLLIEGSKINQLLNGKVNCKWENGDRKFFETLNDKRHGPSIVYDFDSKFKMDYYSNEEKIFL